MKHLITIDPDGVQKETGFKRRHAARAIVVDEEGNVGLLHASRHSYHKLPGGGVDEGEDLVEALKRECLEELGCDIEVLSEIGIIDEYRKAHNLYQTSYCYSAKVVGEKGNPEFTDSEKENGFEIVWVSKPEALKFLKENETTDIQGSFIKLRDIVFLEEFLKG
ncbi:MAG: NUDIX domain-containing protein [Candidatus Paceibacterota bacterium]